MKYLQIFFILMFVNSLQAQNFEGGLVFGLNASQINGDNSAGYNKAGLHAGVRSAYILTPKVAISIEMLYSQRGSRSKESDYLPLPLKINIDYIEIPVAFNIKDWRSKDDTYYRMNFAGGFSYGRLFKSSAENTPFDNKTAVFNKNDFSFCLMPLIL